jgi:hypothetical protein
MPPRVSGRGREHTRVSSNSSTSAPTRCFAVAATQTDDPTGPASSNLTRTTMPVRCATAQSRDRDSVPEFGRAVLCREGQSTPSVGLGDAAAPGPEAGARNDAESGRGAPRSRQQARRASDAACGGSSRRHRTPQEAVRSPRRLGKPCAERSYGAPGAGLATSSGRFGAGPERPIGALHEEHAAADPMLGMYAIEPAFPGRARRDYWTLLSGCESVAVGRGDRRGLVSVMTV